MSKNLAPNKPKSDFYVYALLDPRKPGTFKYGRWTFSHQPFYIGKGVGKRWEQHTRASGTSLKCQTIHSIYRSDLAVPVRIMRRGMLENEAFYLERILIEHIGRIKENGPLTNVASGGGDKHSKPKPRPRPKATEIDPVHKTQLGRKPKKAQPKVSQSQGSSPTRKTRRARNKNSLILRFFLWLLRLLFLPIAWLIRKLFKAPPKPRRLSQTRMLIPKKMKEEYLSRQRKSK